MFSKGMSKSLKYGGGALLSLLKIDTLKFILLKRFFFFFNYKAYTSTECDKT